MLDLRTELVSSIAMMGLGAAVLFTLWRHNHSRASGLGLWLANAILQLASVILIAGRGVLPDFWSVIVANIFVVGGLALLLFGLQDFLGVRVRRWPNYLLLVVFLMVHAYFFYLHPSLEARTLNATLGVIIMSGQSAWLMLGTPSGSLKAVTRGTGIVCAGLALVSAAKLPVDVVGAGVQDIFRLGAMSVFMVILWHVLFAAITFSLVLMVNRRLYLDLERDAAARESDQRALRTSEQKFSAAFRTSPDAVNINRLSDGLYLDINQGFTRLTGYTPEDVVGKSSADIEIWADPADRERLVAALLSDGEVHNLEARFRRKDASLTTALMSARIMDIDGERCILSVTRDISERITAEHALRKSEAGLRRAQRFAHVGSWDWDPRANSLEWSDEMFNIFGVNKSTFTGDLADVISRAIHPDDRAMVEESNRLLAEEGLPTPLEYRVVRPDGSERVVWAEAGELLRDEAGVLVSVSGTVQDITDRKQAEDEILRLNAELEMRVQERTEELTATNEELLGANTELDEATRAKSDFLASMSHELRTPLNSIIGFSDLLARGHVGPLEPEQEKQIGMINTSGKYLLELVNEVLDLSAIEAGHMRIEHAEMDLVAVVKGVIDSLASMAEDRGLELSWCVPDGTRLVSDKTRVEQVLFNIIGNAIKFTDSGSVHVEVRHEPGDLVIEVTDTGQGIAEENLRHIFEQFYQAERRDVAKSEGTGLGLTVSRRLIEMLGGTIEVRSVLGEGSTFTVRLPDVR